MTGFGHATVTDSSDRYVAEIRSVNSRYSETRIFGLREDFSLEFELGKLIKQIFERGKFDPTLRKEPNEKNQNANEDKRIKAHHTHLKKVQKSLGIKGEISLDTVLRTLPAQKDSRNETKNHDQFLKVTQKALENLLVSRRNEGKILASDISKRHAQIVAWYEKIESKIPMIREKRRNDISTKVQTAIADYPLEAKRIEGEIALMIEKGDVTEELVRLKKHLNSFQDLLKVQSQKKPVGRELDFTLQEMHREVNTLGAKIGDVELSGIVVNIKSEMEKIREQVQNIE